MSDQGIRHGITKPSVLVAAIAQQEWKESLVWLSTHHIRPGETASIKDQKQSLSSLQVRGQISEFKFGQVDLGGPDPGTLVHLVAQPLTLQIGMTLLHDGSSSRQDHLST